jgi:endogenous inhibitor of DNA gyrase (YacG/DUF329 family)
MVKMEECIEEKVEPKVVYRDGIAFIKQKHGYFIACLGLHQWTWMKKHGPIPTNHHIHHVDGDRTNNNEENLQCLCDSDHGRLTQFENRKFIGKANCEYCGKKFDSFEYNGGNIKRFCTSKCQNLERYRSGRNTISKRKSRILKKINSWVFPKLLPYYPAMSS